MNYGKVMIQKCLNNSIYAETVKVNLYKLCEDWLEMEHELTELKKQHSAEANPQAANTVLGDERANYENAIYDLIFAYANKDDNMPHTFEHDAIINGYNLLTKAHQIEFAKKIIEDMARLFT